MKLNTLILALTALLLLVTGCQNDPAGPGDGGILLVAGDKSFDNPEFMEVIESLQYETFSGTTQPGLGALMWVQMKTWPKNSTFGLNIPPTALPDDDGNPVTFTMRIPTYKSYIEHAELKLPLLIWLEPSDVNFHEPITVLGTYMPWLDPTVEDVTEYFSIDPIYEEFGAPNVWQDGNRVRVTFQAPHFSLWGVGGGVPDKGAN